MCTLTFCCYDGFSEQVGLHVPPRSFNYGFSEQVGLCVPSHSLVMMDLVNK